MHAFVNYFKKLFIKNTKKSDNFIFFQHFHFLIRNFLKLTINICTKDVH